MSCGAEWFLREALSSTMIRLHIYSLFPRRILQLFQTVGECRRHFYSLFSLWGGLDCKCFCGKMPRGSSGHAQPPVSPVSCRPDKKRGQR